VRPGKETPEYTTRSNNRCGYSSWRTTPSSPRRCSTD
jgi:hypothetical protein